MGRAGSMRAGFAIGRVGAALGAMALSLALLAAPAQAAPRTIAGFGKGAGAVWAPLGVAVHASGGELYVADRNNFRIDGFDPEGNFLLAWGFGVRDGLSAELQSCGPEALPTPTVRCFGGIGGSGAGAVLPGSVAVENSGGPDDGDVYVADSTRRRITRFTPQGEFVWMVGGEVNKTDHTNICTASDLAEGDECGAGLEGAGPGEFTTPLSLAFDPSGNLWVGDLERLVEIEPDGTPGEEIPLPGAGDTKGLAIDSAGDFFVKSEAFAGARKLEAGTGNLLEVIDEAGNAEALALDSADDLYLGDCGRVGFSCAYPYRFKVFDPAGEQTSQFGAGQVIGFPGFTEHGPSNALAIDEASKTLYAASSRSSESNSAVQAFEIPEPGPLPENQRAEEVLPESATLKAELNPEGHETSYHFEWGPSEAYGHETAPEILPGAEFASETVQAPLAELIPATTYHFRLVATNHCNPSEPAEECTVAGEDTTFATRPAVAIEAQWATDLAAKSATVHAEIDPLGVEGQRWVEYGTSPCSEGGCVKAGEAALPESFGAIGVSVALSGLEPATTYRYRFAAEDTRGGVPYLVHGAEQTLTTQPLGLGFALPDGRAWEMVSPARKFGASIESFQGGLVQAAASGNALAYLSRGSIEEHPEGNRSPEDSSVLARRGAGGAWVSEDITQPHRSVTPFGSGFGLEYKLFSPELGKALFEQRDSVPLSPATDERTPYRRTNTTPPGYTPLPSPANALPGFGGNPHKELGATRIQGASADLAHVVLSSGGAADRRRRPRAPSMSGMRGSWRRRASCREQNTR